VSPELVERIRRTTEALRAAAREAGAIVSGDGRVSESTAAALLGIEVTKLRRLRYSGQLPAYHLGVNGGRVSFRLEALATFIELSSEIDDATRPEVGATSDVVLATVAASEPSASGGAARPASGNAPETEPPPPAPKGGSV
jgi:hypothetical protein